jgi:subtilisin family serine protease
MTDLVMFTGKGVRVVVIDTGVDYYHPALGGCFGEGCKISFGYDFVGDDYDYTYIPVEDPDPLATCTGGGHGTHVLGKSPLPSYPLRCVGHAC